MGIFRDRFEWGWGRRSDSFVVGVAGDMGGKGGKVVFHQIGDKVYGYTTDNRTLVDLKIDGTYDYSDPTGVAEAGIATVRGFLRLSIL